MNTRIYTATYTTVLFKIIALMCLNKCIYLVMHRCKLLCNVTKLLFSNGKYSTSSLVGYQFCLFFRRAKEESHIQTKLQHFHQTRFHRNNYLLVYLFCMVCNITWFTGFAPMKDIACMCTDTTDRTY